MITLNAQKRSKTDDLVKVRKDGLVPAVVYGAGVENTPISVPAIDFKKIYKEAGETTAISLSIDGKIVPALIHDIQLDPIRGFAQHVDFLAVDLKKKISTHVPLEFTGVSEAVKSGSGVLVKVLHEIEVEALPSDMPHSLSVDISKLVTLDDNVFASDISLPKGVTLIANAEDVVAAVTAMHEEKEETPALDLSSIEVEKKGKKEEDK
jgi:large subunit ribosomal protein L25